MVTFNSPFASGVILPQRSCWDEVFTRPQGEISDEQRGENLTTSLQIAFRGYIDPFIKDEFLVHTVDEIVAKRIAILFGAFGPYEGDANAV